MTRPLRVLTWHVHGGYLYYLAHGNYELILPYKPERPEGYGGALPGIDWPATVVEVPAERVRRIEFDCVLFQSRRNYEVDQFEILSPTQRSLPRIFLEHDPPRESPTNTAHPVDDPEILLVHVTPFNDLMWDCGRTPTRVIEHGVKIPTGVHYSGELARGIVIVNHLAQRGRRLGYDIYERVRRDIPLDLVGMGSQDIGGLGEIPHSALPAFAARYRFLFNPIRYTSLGLSVCEAMLAGIPVLGLATTEMASAVRNDVSGWVDTRLDVLLDKMRTLLADPAAAARLGAGARRTALERYSLDRFTSEWRRTFIDMIHRARESQRQGEPRKELGHA